MHTLHAVLAVLGGATPSPRPPAPQHRTGGVGFGWLVLTALLGVAGGAGALWYVLRGRLTGRGASAGTGAAEEAARAWSAGGRAWNGGAPNDRDVLVRGLIDLADRLRDGDKSGLWKAANRHLAAAGVESHIADGETFDPELHQAGGYQTTELPQSHLTVASTEEAGYIDRGRVIRRPRVIVYRVAGDDRAR